MSATMTAPLLQPTGAPDAPAASLPSGRTLNYAELDDHARTVARWLTAAGLRPGDRVATVTANSLEHLVLFFACTHADLVLVPLSWRATPAELGVLLADADPALLGTDAAHHDTGLLAAAMLDSGVPTFSLDTLLADAAADRPLPAPRTTTPYEDPHRPADRVGAGEPPVLLLYTSGSSGRPKGVPLTQAHCCATADALASRFPITASDTVLAVLPQFHVAGWNVQPLLGLRSGARLLVVPEFDAEAVLDLIERERVSVMMGVPTTYELLAAAEGFARRDLSSLHTAVVGGAPVDAVLGSAWAPHGVRLWAGYGLTEAGPNVLCEPADSVPGAGWLVPYDGVEVRLDSDRQLLVRGPGVFDGYWREDPATSSALQDGWLATGDVAEESLGRYRPRGRISEKYISGGENVHPAEVERALRRLPAVAEAAVVGVPDPRWGEAGVAFVVPAAGQRPDPEQLRRELREHLAGFKVPREVVLVDELPQTGTGKIDKRSLRGRLGPAQEGGPQ